MKKLIIGSLLFIVGLSVARAEVANTAAKESKTNLSCDRKGQGNITFEINKTLGQINFSNDAGLAKANIATNKSIEVGITTKSVKKGLGSNLHVEYKWGEAADDKAQLDFQLDKNLEDLSKAGDKVNLVLTGDDNDGAYFEKVPFKCTVM